MLDFMRNGGFVMWPLLALGLVAVAAATRPAFMGAESDGLPERLARGGLAVSVAGSLLGLTLVLRAAVSGPPEILLIGLSEAMCPAILGLTIYAAVTLLSTLTAARLAR